MPRPRRDGTPAAPANKRKLSDVFVKKLKPTDRTQVVWDSHQRGLALMVQRTGTKSWKFIYTARGAPRWLHIGDAGAIGLADARLLASRAAFAVAEGRDPVAERKAERSSGTFQEIAERYVEQHAKRRNKSWKQADALVRKHLIPRWGKMPVAQVTRADVKRMVEHIAAPITANQTLAAASAIFTWCVKEGVVAVNPCVLVERNPTRSRQRVLSDVEVPAFWQAFDAAGPVHSVALKVLLLTGQRPGEVVCMRREHIRDGWWTMPGDPVPELGWPGTKNKEAHELWLPPVAREMIDEAAGTGFVFHGVSRLDDAMRKACAEVGAERATPHDLRRTHGTTITSLGFGRDAMNRIQNHKEGGIGDVYDMHKYRDEKKRVMEAVERKIMGLVDGTGAGNVVRLRS